MSEQATPAPKPQHELDVLYARLAERNAHLFPGRLRVPRAARACVKGPAALEREIWAFGQFQQRHEGRRRVLWTVLDACSPSEPEWEGVVWIRHASGLKERVPIRQHPALQAAVSEAGQPADLNEAGTAIFEQFVRPHLCSPGDGPAGPPLHTRRPGVLRTAHRVLGQRPHAPHGAARSGEVLPLHLYPDHHAGSAPGPGPAVDSRRAGAEREVRSLRSGGPHAGGVPGPPGARVGTGAGNLLRRGTRATPLGLRAGGPDPHHRAAGSLPVRRAAPGLPQRARAHRAHAAQH